MRDQAWPQFWKNLSVHALVSWLLSWGTSHRFSWERSQLHTVLCYDYWLSDTDCISCTLGLGSQSAQCDKHKYDDPKSLPMDTALVFLISNVKNPVNVFGVSSNCHKCGLQLIKENLTAPRGFTYNKTVETNFGFTLAVYNAVTNKIVCP